MSERCSYMYKTINTIQQSIPLITAIYLHSFPFCVSVTLLLYIMTAGIVIRTVENKLLMYVCMYMYFVSTIIIPRM